jgi:hypothetical protein
MPDRPFAPRSPRSPRPNPAPRSRFARRLAWLTGALLGLQSLALVQAQIVDPSCPIGAICHPNGSGLEFVTDTVDVIGGDMNYRRHNWDCTGLGPEGCLGLMMVILMCQIDGREWVQQYACAAPAEPPPAGGGGGGGGAGAPGDGGDGAPGDGGDGAPPPADAPGGPADVDPDAEPLLVVQNPDLNRWVRGALERTRAGSSLTRVRIGDRGTLEAFVWGVYEIDRGDAGEYFAVVRLVDSVDRRELRVVLGGLGRTVFVGELSRVQNYKRRGAAPPPSSFLLALGGR